MLRHIMSELKVDTNKSYVVDLWNHGISDTFFTYQEMSLKLKLFQFEWTYHLFES